MTPVQAPSFWWREAGWQAKLLTPLSALYAAVSGRRMDRGERAEAGLPVLCVGNFTVGGGGKTPTVLALGRAAQSMGLRPGFLTRGHGGRSRQPMLVDPARHGASLVGDEPMLLAQAAPTAVAVDRRRGAALLANVGCDILIMDDGFQSARLQTELALVVVDAHRALGNGRVLPAGPLRAPLGTQIRHADALLLVGAGPGESDVETIAAQASKPLFRARLEVVGGTELAGQRCLAFSGIADPAKFHRSLSDVDAEIAETRVFADHHRLSEREARGLIERAAEADLKLVTTAKDRVRLTDGGVAARALAEATCVLDVALRFERNDTAENLIRKTLAAFASRAERHP